MKVFYRTITLAFLALTTLTLNTSCEKDEDETTQTDPEPTPTPPAPDPVYPNNSDADAVLVGIKTVSITSSPIMPMPIETVVGTAVGFFTETTGDFNVLTDAGTVDCNSNRLSKNTNPGQGQFAYVYTPGLANPNGIDFTDGAKWEVSGSANFTAVIYTHSNFPSNPVVSSGNVYTSQSYTLTLDEYVTGADSIYYAIYGADDYIIKVGGPTTTSMEFTAAELSGLGATDYGMIQATACDITDADYSTKKIYFVNETVNTKTVKIQ